MLDDTHKADLVMQGIYLAEKALEKLPPAQPERKKAFWDKDEHYGEAAYVCTCCETIWTSAQIENMHFCPTCGADMRGESDE